MSLITSLAFSWSFFEQVTTIVFFSSLPVPNIGLKLGDKFGLIMLDVVNRDYRGLMKAIEKKKGR